METLLYKVYKNDCGSIIYRNADGKLHRSNGPAIEDIDGSKYWYQNGERHRSDGPAIENSNGYKAWWFNGKKHRTDGPAIECIDGSKEFYIDGIQLTEEEFIKRTTVQEFSMDEIALKLGIPVELLKIKK